MIVSVHIPRTAGSSFRAYLRRSPSIRLKEDYGNPIMVPSYIRQLFAIGQRGKLLLSDVPTQYDCIHGHFLPFKYKDWAKQPEVKFVTWFREPADRIRSQFDYCFQSDKQIDRSPFQNKVAREKWSFEAFVHHPHAQNLYQKILWRFPVELFDFVGVVEYFDLDFQYFCSLYFNDQQALPTFGNKTHSSPISEEDIMHIQSLNHKDYLLYNWALAHRNKRMQP